MTNDEIKNAVKAEISKAGSNVSQAVKRMNEKYTDRQENQANFNSSINRASLPIWKYYRLADALGYDIFWEKREK